MMGPSHRLLGAVAGASWASLTGAPLSGVVIGAVAGTATASGPTSPDVDQTDAWRDVPLPGALRQHRHGLAHWWGLPVVAAWLVRDLPPETVWAASALIAGWVSHLVGDFIFGTLAVLPWGGPRFGLGLRTDGFVESGVLRVRGRARRVLPFSPLRIILGALLVAVVWARPTTGDLTHTLTGAWNTLAPSLITGRN